MSVNIYNATTGNLVDIVNDKFGGSLAEREFKHYYGLMNETTEIIRDPTTNEVTSIDQVSTEATSHSVFTKTESEGVKITTIVNTITPVQGTLKYINTTVIAGDEITNSYTSAPKEGD